MFSFSLVEPPACEPVTLAEAKAHARIDTDTEDALISTLIMAARQWAEKYTGRAFITQTWCLAIDQFSAGAKEACEEKTAAGLEARVALNLPRAPLQSVTSVQYYNNGDQARVWPDFNYFVDTAHEPGRLALRADCAWPLSSRVVSGIAITYKAGYGSEAALVPEPIKMAIRQLVAFWYEYRGDIESSPCAPQVVLALLDPYRLRFPGV